MFWDKDGNVIGVYQWGRYMEDDAYRVLKQDHCHGRYYISTIWLGIDHTYERSLLAPLIFETKVFDKAARGLEAEIIAVHYATVPQAFRGHALQVSRWSYGEPVAPDRLGLAVRQN